MKRGKSKDGMQPNEGGCGDGVDISLWPVTEAPQDLRKAFPPPLPTGGSILLFAAHQVNDIALEAAILAR